MDGFDNRPGVFWAHVVAALRRSGMAMPAASARRAGPGAAHVFLLGLAAALAAQEPPVTLVLDDLHLLTDPELLDGLGPGATRSGKADHRGGQPGRGMDPSERLPAALVTRCPLRLLPSVKALRDASRSGRT